MRRLTMRTIVNSGFRSALPLSVLLAAAAVLLTGAMVEGQQDTPFVLTSTAFKEGGRIPDRYTCTAQNVSPALAWTGIPKGTVSLALIMDDPDAAAKPWVHWVMYNIDPKTTGLAEGVSIGAIGALSGTTSFKSLGYGGPCPPVGAGNHHYVFTLYALSESPNLKEGATRVELLAAMEGITIAKTTLVGLYSRD
jgi:Raf kinase inhibitor-like YbhB/YbcL family protein